MSIRHATLAEVPVTVMLAQAMHAETAYRNLEFDQAKVTELFTRLVQDEPGCLLVVEKDDVLVGFLAGGIGEDYFGPGQFAFEFGVYLDPRHRGGVCGARLVQAFLAWADSLGVHRKHMAVSTGITTDRTGALYEKLGAERAGNLYTWGM